VSEPEKCFNILFDLKCDLFQKNILSPLTLKQKTMSTVELEVKKNQLVRKILNERNENIIVSMEESLRRLKRSAIYSNEKKKLVKDFFLFADNNSIKSSNFKFNREDCYER